MIPGTSSILDTMMEFVEGDTCELITFTIQPTEAALLEQVRIHYRTDDNATRAALKLENGDGLTITSNTTSSWVVTLDAQRIPLKAGSYVWQLETTDADDVRKTYLQGKLTVHRDYVKP